MGLRVLTLDVDDSPGSLRGAIASAAAYAGPLRLVREMLPTRLGRPAAEFVLEMLAPEAALEDASAVAWRWGQSPRSLRRSSERLGVPAPRTLLRWARLFLAFGAHRVGARSGTEVAIAIGYEHPSSVNRLFRSLLGRSPGEVLGAPREETRAVRCFVNALSA